MSPRPNYCRSTNAVPAGVVPLASILGPKCEWGFAYLPHVSDWFFCGERVIGPGKMLTSRTIV
jgi:hypothetical protein